MSVLHACIRFLLSGIMRQASDRLAKCRADLMKLSPVPLP